MNFEILYTYSIYEEHIMASLTGKHTKGKEMMDYNYEMHRNLYSNKPTFNSTILLAIGHKMHNTISHGFQPSLPQLREYL